MDQKGFTLIELIVIIVILGILAVTAIPKYVDMKTDAELAAAQGVYGAAQGAATLNFAATLLNKNTSADWITTGQKLFDAMEEQPENWIADGNDICKDVDASTNCTAADYVITVSTPESATTKAILTKSGLY